MSRALIRESLPPEQRLALAYAASQSRDALLCCLGLDVRLAQIVTGAREPMLAQIRLAWWRDRLADDAARVAGEPLLVLIYETRVPLAPLRALIDAWEGLLNEPSTDRIEALAHARSQALCGSDFPAVPDARHLEAAREWALFDLSRIPGEWGDLARSLADAQPWRAPRLPRAHRHLAILHALARQVRKAGSSPPGPASIVVAVRVGLFGR